MCQRESQAINAYAVIVGTPAADTRDVKATGEGRIVQSKSAPTAQIILTALRGCPSGETCEIHPDMGNTPSLAIAKISLDAAITATEVFSNQPLCNGKRTKTSPRMAIVFMTQ